MYKGSKPTGKNSNSEARIINKISYPSPIMLPCKVCGQTIGMYSFRIDGFFIPGNFCDQCGAKIDKQSYIMAKDEIIREARKGEKNGK